MYQVTIKGRNLKELKKAVDDINSELGNGAKTVNGLERNLEVTTKPVTTATELTETIQSIAPVVTGTLPPAIKEEEYEVSTLYTESGDIPAIPLKEALIAQTAPNPGEAVIAPMVEALAQTVSDMGELDCEGQPWDIRIHTTKKTKLATGQWKLKRGADKDLAAQIKAQTPTVANVAELPLEVVAPVVVAPVAVAPLPMTLAVPANGHTLETFLAGFPMIVATLISEGKVTQDYINQLKTYFKVDQIWNISEAQKGEVFNSFVEFKFIQKVG